MRKILLLFLYLFAASFCFAQKDTDSVFVNTDSIEKELDAFLALNGYLSKRNTCQLSAGIHNSSLSVNNKALNVQQTNNPLVLSSSFQYQHKSGWNISAEPRMLAAGNESGFLQSAFSTGYRYDRNAFLQAGIVYTNYLKNPNLSKYATPYTHEWYGYSQTSKWKINPFLSVGYAIGRYQESTIKDSSFLLDRPFPRPDTLIQFRIYDTLRVGLRDFSVSTGCSYRFLKQGKQADRFLIFTTSMMLFFVQNRYDVEYASASVLSPRTRLYLQQRPILREELIRQLRQQFSGFNQTRSFLNTSIFQLQSMGLNLDAEIYRKHFFINPQIYLDYYLLSNQNQLNIFFSLQTGWIF
jgi:hypothetical protein